MMKYRCFLVVFVAVLGLSLIADSTIAGLEAAEKPVEQSSGAPPQPSLTTDFVEAGEVPIPHLSSRVIVPQPIPVECAAVGVIQHCSECEASGCRAAKRVRDIRLLAPSVLLCPECVDSNFEIDFAVTACVPQSIHSAQPYQSFAIGHATLPSPEPVGSVVGPMGNIEPPLPVQAVFSIFPQCITTPTMANFEGRKVATQSSTIPPERVFSPTDEKSTAGCAIASGAPVLLSNGPGYRLLPGDNLYRMYSRPNIPEYAWPTVGPVISYPSRPDLPDYSWPACEPILNRVTSNSVLPPNLSCHACPSGGMSNHDSCIVDGNANDQQVRMIEFRTIAEHSNESGFEPRHADLHHMRMAQEQLQRATVHLRAAGQKELADNIVLYGEKLERERIQRQIEQIESEQERLDDEARELRKHLQELKRSSGRSWMESNEGF